MLITYLLIILISVLVGFINTLAGSGSLIMLPLLIFMGLSAPVANGTNRVAILFQSIVGVNTFMRHKKVKIGTGWWVIIPAVWGAMLGAWLATQMDAEQMKQFVGVLLIVMLLLLVIKPERWLKETNIGGDNAKKTASGFLMFCVGMYGGFIQAGIGLFLLAALVLGIKYSLGEANALKLIIVLAYALPVLLIFVWSNQVNWFYGLLTALGQMLGAYLGAKFATQYKNANLWIYRLLLITVLGSIIQFYELWRYIS